MIPLADGDMAALDFGDPERPVDVVFSHANGFNALTYRSILAPLSAGLRLLVIDQRGHGSSTLPANPQGRTSWYDLRDDLAALLDQLGGPPVILAGHSMGGAASIMAAALRPDRVKSLVLFDPVVITLPQMLSALLPLGGIERFRTMPLAARALTRRALFPSAAEVMTAYRGKGAFRGWPDTVLADYIAGGFRPRDDGQVELACAPAWESSNFCAMANNIWGLAGRVRAPMHLYCAETGSTCRIGRGRLFLRANRRSTLTVVPGSSHFLPMERPDLVREAILDAVGEA